MPYRPEFVKYNLHFLQQCEPKKGNRITLPAKFDRRHQFWIRRHWEWIRWQRYNHPPKQTELNRFALSHGFLYFHPLLYNGYFTKNKNLTKIIQRFGPNKRRFRQRYENRYQAQR